MLNGFQRYSDAELQEMFDRHSNLHHGIGKGANTHWWFGIIGAGLFAGALSAAADSTSMMIVVVQLLVGAALIGAAFWLEKSRPDHLQIAREILDEMERRKGAK